VPTHFPARGHGWLRDYGGAGSSETVIARGRRLLAAQMNPAIGRAPNTIASDNAKTTASATPSGDKDIRAVS
jgi:hypothetical protein